MRTFSIEGKSDSPDVFIDESKKTIEISGNSTLKETNWFYSNLLKWMIALNFKKSEKIIINIRLNRINDSSTKWLKVIFKKFKHIVPACDIQINWYVETRSPRIKASGLSLQHETDYRVVMLTA